MSPHFLSTYLLSFPFLFLSSSLSASLVWIAFGTQRRRTRDGDERWSQIYGWVNWKRGIWVFWERGWGSRGSCCKVKAIWSCFDHLGLCVCACVCVCYCITTIASMSLSSSDRVFCRWEDFLLYFWQWLNRSKQVCYHVCLHAFMCLCFSLTFLQKCRTEITKKRSRLLF